MKLHRLLQSLIHSLTLCENEGDISDAVQKVMEEAGMTDIEWANFRELRAKLEESGVRGLWS